MPHVELHPRNAMRLLIGVTLSRVPRLRGAEHSYDGTIGRSQLKVIGNKLNHYEITGSES